MKTVHRTRRGFSFAVMVLVLVSIHLMVIRSVTATTDDALSSAWAIQGARAEAGLDSALHIAAGELLAERTPPTGEYALPDGTRIEIVVNAPDRPWSVTLSARSGESYRQRTLIID